ncbi:MAG TPA: bifunctional oligoribonuclease/PAP phosphatase NrnA [Candidatus Polarisedimenticolia bacterium]|nr:bifunctional oligoribonuclease/PAP phosphatase NrnA [Candidatus Polarisedimenticolia bacterium]
MTERGAEILSGIDWRPVGSRIEEAARGRRPAVLSTHVNPDGDGLGSQLALRAFLRERGVDVRIVNNDPVHAKYAFLPGVEAVEVFDEARHAPLIASAALLFVLDNSSPERLGRLLPAARATGACKICIDHHVTVDPFWDLNCIDTEASASGQLVYEMVLALGGRITAAMAEPLYVSFVTDTGHFRFGKTTARVHRIIADLMDAGPISPPRVYRSLFEGVPPGLNRLVALALADTHYEYGGRFAWARLTLEQLRANGGPDEDTGDLVNMLLAVKGVEAAALFKELPEGRTKVSLRSLGDVDIHALAESLGGGGHRNASGITMAAPLGEGVRRVVDGMRGVLGA